MQNQIKELIIISPMTHELLKAPKLIDNNMKIVYVQIYAIQESHIKHQQDLLPANN